MYRKSLTSDGCSMWFITFFMSFCSSSISNLTVYVTSDFQKHSLTALTGVISSLVAGIWKLPYAKIMVSSFWIQA